MIEHELKREAPRTLRVVKADKQEDAYLRDHAIAIMRIYAKRYPQDAKKIFREVLQEKLLTTT